MPKVLGRSLATLPGEAGAVVSIDRSIAGGQSFLPALPRAGRNSVFFYRIYFDVWPFRAPVVTAVYRGREEGWGRGEGPRIIALTVVCCLGWVPYLKRVWSLT